MSLWKIGVDDVSQETQQFKDKLASKDGHIAAQQAQLMKQSEEFEEIKASLNEALQKLANESERVLHLEKDLIQCKGDLRNEKNAARNIEASLQAANDKLKAKDVETRDLEATLERLSGISNDHNNRSTKLGHEKTALEKRIRELEANLRQLSAAAASSRRAPLRTPSDQFNGLRVNQLEKDHEELQEELKEKDKELSSLQEKLSHAQDELLRVDNERTAKEARTKSELEEMRSLLQEKDEELEFYRNQANGEREETLLQRIEEDGAKIAAYEAMLKQSDNAKGLKERLKSAEQRLKAETVKVADLESRNIVLVREREDALSELEDVRTQMHVLEDRIQEHEENVDAMKEERSRLALAISGQDSELPDDVDTKSIVNGVDVTHVAKLLEAIVRLRGERDDLRRRLQFLEMEHKFTVEALEKRLPDTSVTVDLSNSRVTQPNVDEMQSQGGKVQRLANTAAACAVLLLHSQTQLEGCNQLLSDSWEREQYAKGYADAEAEKCLALEDEVDHILYQLRESEEKVKDLETELGVKDGEWEDMEGSRKYLQDRAEKLEADLEEMSRTLEIVESERNSLALQVNNLTTDLQAAQDELENAEGRYSALQFQQLSSMTSNEVTRTLRDQIAELEGRVMRRTELVGVHQHDIKRLETNLRLQEERLAEMTMELETLATQKEAMLEDCADAREARDEALAQIETLDVELENTESRLFDSDKTLNSLICLLVQSTSSAQHTQARISELEVDLYESQVARDILELDLVDMQTTQADLRQATVALAATQLEFNNIVARVQGLIIEKNGLTQELAFASQQVEEQEVANRRLKEECATLRDGSSTSVAQLVAQSSEYQAEIDQLNKTISEAKAESEVSRQRLAHAEIELGKVQQEKKRVVAEREKVTSDLIQAHKKEMEVLQEDLSTASAVLEEERASRVVLEQEHVEALAQAQSKVDGLEKRAEALNQELSQLSSSQDDLQAEREKALQQLETLRIELKGLLVEKVKAEEVQHDLTVTNEHLSEELAQLKKEQETTTLGAKSHTDQRQQELESQKAELQSKIDELTHAAENVTQEIRLLSQELDQERQRVRDNEDQHSAETQSLIRERDAIQSSLTKFQEDIIKLQDAIERNETALATSEGEKDRLQENITDLEAQIQKLLSYTHSLEHQVEDG
ncbi:hypothetical protein P691DRAFT_718155 [Macrolepiota fuliginosa MF-IS2]|uniref:Uncharacterized protein n=1 Tax=Macrolepiota fuliginosa MF-IS2 TaxID=1400762 RepID=A0A9P5XQY9_9AGAR|nr:hypothetical protein P691DRAFT_718155 [Macrolepiota fuliginosa MF-IS2]